jgi:hypothetical protein
MLKALIQVVCDSCSQQFFFTRASTCEPNAWRFNTTVLTAMLQQYQWRVEGKEHYCLECWGEMGHLEEMVKHDPDF